MKTFPTILAIILFPVSLFANADQDEVIVNHASVQSQEIKTGSSQYFSGQVKVDSLFQRNSPSRLTGGTVYFAAGARTAWHTHPLGQTLIVLSGTGWVQQWGHPAQPIKPGDMIWSPPHVKHWHGASATSPMSHIAISEALNGKTVTWLEQVSDSQYPKN